MGYSAPAGSRSGSSLANHVKGRGRTKRLEKPDGELYSRPITISDRASSEPSAPVYRRRRRYIVYNICAAADWNDNRCVGVI